MPSLKMKRQNCGLHVCQKSTVISKNTQCHSPPQPQVAESDNLADGAFGELVADGRELDEQRSLGPVSLKAAEMEVSPVVQSNLQSMFSPSIEASEESALHWDAGVMWADFTAKSTTDDSDNSSSDQAQDPQTCNISDYLISDMIVTELSFEEATSGDPAVYNCVNTSLLFDMICDAVEPSSSESTKSSHEGDKPCLYVSMDQLRSCSLESETSPYLNYDEERCASPQWNLANFPESISSCDVQKTAQKRKSVTLVLDLDETLIHSSFDRCDEADFTFPVFFDMKEHTVYVRQRPFLRVFLEKVTEMFEVVIFTASQSIYAKQLLDILDPDGKIISRRYYRESCIFSNGCHTKDLTVLGVDLAKVAIIDNTPEVFQLQVNNGIPIKSWFDDPSDRELLSLLPLLESIVDAEDVRPIIAKKFGNKNQTSTCYRLL
uniref:FCP1 homology domain-containing protein n=2 Tax=Kalanchoe fedtschenkoi TaxID=63787 RepID=A0A7N0RF91_KALFE